MEIGLKMMRIIGAALFEKNDTADMAISEEEFSKIYALAEKHDITNMVGYSLKKINKLPKTETGKQFERKIAESYYRFLRIEETANEVYSCLRENKIDFIPLKGAVIRNFYPDKWLRTSCDIDILVKEEETQNAVDCLCKLEGYKKSEAHTWHDITVISKTGVHTEIHYALAEEQEDYAFETPWEYAVKQEGCLHKFTDEYLYAYIVYHGAKHFLLGGCGARMLVDIMLLKNNLSLNDKELTKLLQKLNLEEFEKQISLFSKNALLGGELNSLQKDMAKLIFSGGVYGNNSNMRVVEQGNKTRYKYIFDRIWAPYESLLERYPKIKGKKYLIPFYQVKRWRSAVKNKGAKSRITQLNNALNEDQDKIDSVKKMISDLGLR